MNSRSPKNRPFSRSVPAALALVFLAAPAASAQSPFVPPFQGLQPDLIQGVQDGLATGDPKVRHVYVAAPDTLGVIIDAQAIPYRPLEKYEKQPGDQIRETRPHSYGQEGKQYFRGRTIIRDGKTLGEIFGPKQDHYSPAYTLEGEPLDLEWADNKASFALSSPDDPAFRQATSPVEVSRKTKPEVREYVGGQRESTYRHEVFLKFPEPLTPGLRYQLAFENGSKVGPGVTFTFDDRRLRSEAIQVNLHGYHPEDQEKIALAGRWLSEGGDADLSGYKTFEIVEDRTGEVVFKGDVTLQTPASFDLAEVQRDLESDALTMSLYAMDFSKFSRPGVYRVVVPGLGSSFPFRIDDRVWRDAAFIAAKGLYTHRASTEVGPPYTSGYKRPRNFHHADGFRTYKIDPEIFYDEKRFPKETTPNAFGRIQAAILDDTDEPKAWGGWHDAADYDRSILPQVHTLGVHALLDLYDSDPAFYEKFDLGIPESDNRIPDVIDEALWCMDLFLRLQQPDGGIPSAVESIEHPNEPSWLLLQPTAVTPPTPATCHLYAAAAAQLALALRKYDPARAEAYRTSALRAMEWAEKNQSVPNIYDSRPGANSAEAENFADLWMYRLTADQKWHTQFKKSLADLSPENALRANLVYSLMPADQVDAAVQKKAREAIIRGAEAQVARTNQTFNLGPSRNWWHRIANPPELIAAHRLTGDPKYLRALQRMAQFSLGRNPQNASYTTGLGARQVVPFNLDAHYLGVPYPEGVTTWGPIVPTRDPNAAPLQSLDGIHPPWREWPWAESYFNVRDYRFNEYTVATNMAFVLMMHAYLAQQADPS